MGDLSIQSKIDQVVAEFAVIWSSLPAISIIFDLRKQPRILWMSDNGLNYLGCTLEELRKMPLEEYLTKYFNPEEADDYGLKTIDLLTRNQQDEFLSIFQQVRSGKTGTLSWHHTASKILLRDEDKTPVLLICLAIPLDTAHTLTVKAEKLLEENTFLRQHMHLFRRLSKRECDILQSLALGKSSSETADSLYISVNTVETHKKNIRRKLGTSSFYELCRYARAFDLI